MCVRYNPYLWLPYRLSPTKLKKIKINTALSGKMMVHLADAVDDLEKWERGVALILHGEGGNFCAGADLSLAREHLVTGADGRLMCALMTDTLTRLKR